MQSRIDVLVRAPCLPESLSPPNAGSQEGRQLISVTSTKILKVPRLPHTGQVMETHLQLSLEQNIIPVGLG